MMGIIFDIKELALHDGPGIRTTVFFKGCPLRCQWCHNPEGLSFSPQLLFYASKCIKCHECKKVCKHPSKCIACGECVLVCPTGARRLAGIKFTAAELSGKLARHKDFLAANKGGVTVSGGEPLAQPEFLMELLKNLRTLQIHTVLDSSGYADKEIFREAVNQTDMVLFDLKHTDASIHTAFTGKDNKLILANLELLNSLGKPFILRIPLIPGVNDDEKNMKNTASIARNCGKTLYRIELLPYNTLAGAKYNIAGMRYNPDFDKDRKPEIDAAVNIFKKQKLKVIIA